MHSAQDMIDFSYIMGNNIGKAAVIDFGIQWSLWAIASALKTEKFYDLAGNTSILCLLLGYVTYNDAWKLN